MASIKFGLLWLLRQPEQERFTSCMLGMLSKTGDLLEEFLAREHIQADQIGYRRDTRMLMLQHTNDFSDAQRGVDLAKHP